LSGKHSSAPGHTGIFPDDDKLLRRSWTAVAVVLAVALTVLSIRWLWSVPEQDGLPLMIQPPALAAVSAPATAAVSAPAPARAPGSPPAAAVPSAVRVPSRAAAPRRTVRDVTRPRAPVPKEHQSSTKPPAPPRRSPAAKAAVAASYLARASWDTGFIGGLQVVNTGSVAQSWEIRLRFADADRVNVGQAWNATLSRQGDTVVLRGGPLAPGASVNAGFRAGKQARDAVRPTACTVNQRACG
jgi:Cellulose binding domain